MNDPPPVMGDEVRNFVHNSIQLISGIQEEEAPHDDQEEEVPHDDQEEVPHNVLAQYHKKNRSNLPPKLAQLSNAALLQAKKHGQPEDNENHSQESDAEDQDQARAARHSKSLGGVKPDTMAYYKGTPWWVILTEAKIKYRCHIALNHGFPDRDEHLGEARDILLEAIEDFKGKNGSLDQS
jgi:hypothetical protein